MCRGGGVVFIFFIFFCKVRSNYICWGFFINRRVYVGGIGGIIISNLIVKIYN